MPIPDPTTSVFDYQMSKMGVNLSRSVNELHPAECLLSQNLFYRNGMVKRGGSSLVDTDEVVSSKPILGLHKFYRANGTSQLLAACGTTVKYLSSGTWTNAVTGLTTGLTTHMTTWGALDKVFICNGTDAMRSWSGSASATITIADGVPTQALPYQDRLLTIIGGTLTWSASFDATGASWGTAANIGVKPDTVLYGMSIHSDSNTTAGYRATVLLAGANGMYLFYGTDLRWPSTTGDYGIEALPVVGCTAPRTMCWTPAGTMWLGVDRQVYLLPFNSNMPIPVGQKIRSTSSNVQGIEDLPVGSMSDAVAVYHDGFYKLSVPQSGQTSNTTGWWLDCTRLYKDEDNHWGPWYGPMTGQTISCFANQNGTGDGGELLGGEATDKGYVYYLHDSGYYGDVDPSDAGSNEIAIAWQAPYLIMGDTFLPKDINHIELEMYNCLGSANISYYDIMGAVKIGDVITLNGSGVFWDDDYWGADPWGGAAPTRIVQNISPTIQVRRLSLLLTQSSNNDTFQLYGARVEATSQSLVFG